MKKFFVSITYIFIFQLILECSYTKSFAQNNLNICDKPSDAWIITYFFNILSIEEFIMAYSNCVDKFNSVQCSSQDMLKYFLMANFSYEHSSMTKQKYININNYKKLRTHYLSLVKPKISDNYLNSKKFNLKKYLNFIKKYTDIHTHQNWVMLEGCYINSQNFCTNSSSDVFNTYQDIKNKFILNHKIVPFGSQTVPLNFECLVYYAFIDDDINTDFATSFLEYIHNDNKINLSKLSFFNISLSLQYFHTKQYAKSLAIMHSINSLSNFIYKTIYNKIQKVYAYYQKAEGRVGLNPNL